MSSMLWCAAEDYPGISCNEYEGCCCTATHNDTDLVELKIVSKFNARYRPSLQEFVISLRAGGSVFDYTDAESHKDFLRMLDANFPELRFYRIGSIQVSPGVEEIEGSPAEYYRTIGAIIALLSVYIYTQGHQKEGIALVSAGDRGPMSTDKIPGKFINIGNKPEEYEAFCKIVAENMKSEEDWWAMMVFLAVHDVGKSDAFRNRVNKTLPRNKRSDDHDKVLALALKDQELCQELMPSVAALAPERQSRIAEGFSTGFQLPQLGQGEIPICRLKGIIELPKTRLYDGTLRTYLLHSIFDIAGASCNEKFIFPLAVSPVYTGFSNAMEDLMRRLSEPGRLDERSVYFEFLGEGFRKAFPDYEESTFRTLCDSRVFRDETGLVFLRIFALTRNTYKNPGALLSHLSLSYPMLVNEMAGNVQGPQIMLYYGPDMIRMGLGADMEDATGCNMREALNALDTLYSIARKKLKQGRPGDVQFELNVQPIVKRIKDAGQNWGGGAALAALCPNIGIDHNDLLTEGIVTLN